MINIRSRQYKINAIPERGVCPNYFEEHLMENMRTSLMKELEHVVGIKRVKTFKPHEVMLETGRFAIIYGPAIDQISKAVSYLSVNVEGDSQQKAVKAIFDSFELCNHPELGPEVFGPRFNR